MKKRRTDPLAISFRLLLRNHELRKQKAALEKENKQLRTRLRAANTARSLLRRRVAGEN